MKYVCLYFESFIFMQLVSGLKTGAANVSLSFRYHKMKIVIEINEVRLFVMEICLKSIDCLIDPSYEIGVENHCP